MTTEANPFEPCTVEGLAAELWKLNCQISDLYKLRQRRDHIEQTLLDLMLRLDESVVEGDHPTLRLTEAWEYDHDRHTGKIVPGLVFDRRKNDD